MALLTSSVPILCYQSWWSTSSR